MPESPRDAVTLTDSERATLLNWSRSRTRSYALTQRARIVLACADQAGDQAGAGDAAVAEQLGISRAMVGRWRSRFLAEGLDGLDDRPRSGRPRKTDGEAVLRILTLLLGPPPGDGREWSTRAMAAETGLSQATVSRVWREHRLQTRAAGRTRPESGGRRSFADVEVRNLAGLFVDPPARVLAVVARRRAAPPADGEPRVNRLAVGARNLVAVADALTLVRPPAAAPDAHLNAFLEALEQAVPAPAEVHLLVDADPGTAARDALDTWAGQHPRFHRHFVPADSTWLDEAEALLTKTLPAGHSDPTGYETSLPELRQALRGWSDTGTRASDPFAWTNATYDSTVEKSEQESRPTAADDERAAADMSDPAVQRVLEALLTAALASDEQVKEAPLAARLGASRRSVRKALRVLADEGLLERTPGRGTAVPHVDITAVLDLYAVRATLGAVLMRRAAMLDPAELQPVRAALTEVRSVARRNDHSRVGQADLHFQDMVARAASLPQASLFFQRLTLRVRMFITVLGLDFADAAADLIAREDARIFEAIRDGDGDEAARLWRVKVERSVRFMAAQLPDSTFDPNLWVTIAGKPERRAGDPRKSSGVS